MVIACGRSYTIDAHSDLYTGMTSGRLLVLQVQRIPDSHPELGMCLGFGFLPALLQVVE